MFVQHSEIDQSTNFIEERDIGYTECRFVQRHPDYICVYLSSQTGCNRGCKFCHLTTTGQTRYENCSLQDYLSQAAVVFQHARLQGSRARIAHFNFMARGEPLANPVVLEESLELLTALGKMAAGYDFLPKFNISTIMPVTMRRRLIEVFPILTPTIYYSIYSLNPVWRRRWLPAAQPVDKALDMLSEYQSVSKKIIKFHSAFIEGENDGYDDIAWMLDEIMRRRIYSEFNIVRYNPSSDKEGRETRRLMEIKAQISNVMPVKIIDRVGSDVHASCGMFYS